jgi:hypothetical protein
MISGAKVSSASKGNQQQNFLAFIQQDTNELHVKHA